MCLLAAGFSAIFLGAANLIPMKIGGIPNDGENIKEALKSHDARRGFYIMFKANAEMAKGKKLCDFGKNDFAVGENADLSNYLVANTVLLYASQLEESGAFEQSYNELLRLDSTKLPPFYGAQLILAIVFQELVLLKDEVFVMRARSRMEAKANDKLFQKFLQMKHPAFLPFQAAKKAFLDDDFNKAQELIALARKLNHTLQNPGQEYSVTLMLDRLESRMALACMEKPV